MNALGIAIDGGRYVRFNADSDNGVSTVHLQTLGIGADSARLDFVSFNRGRAVVRRSCVVSGIRRRGKPGEIRVQVRRRSRFVWTALVTPVGAPQSEVKIRTGRALWPFLVLLLPVPLILIFQFAFPMRNLLWTEEEELRMQPGDSRPVKPAETASPSSFSYPASAAAPEESPTRAEAAEAPSPLLRAVSPPTAGSSVFPVTLFFAPESAFLNAASLALLDEAAESLPEGSFILRVEGHSADFGTQQGRIRLSRRRARAAAEYLTSRIGENLRIESEGFGVDRPATEDPLFQNLNRRVEIRIEPTVP